MKQNDNIKLSIIIPVYNSEKYLEECLDSVVREKALSMEVIIVDDGSTDGSATVYDSYAENDYRIKVIKKENGGVSSARNEGLENANGEYIAFLDSDDFVETNTYSKMIQHIEKSGADLLIWNYYFLNGNKASRNVDFPEEAIIKNRQKIDMLKATNLCPLITDLKTPNNKIIGIGFPWNKIFKASLIKDNKLRFTKEIDLYEDVLFMFQYMKYVKVVEIVDEPRVYYRQLNAGLTEAYKPNIEQSNKVFISKLVEELPNMTECQREAYYSRIIRCLSCTLKYNVMHSANKCGKIKQIKNILDNQPAYREAMSKVKREHLTSKQKIMLHAIRLLAS